MSDSFWFASKTTLLLQYQTNYMQMQLFQHIFFQCPKTVRNPWKQPNPWQNVRMNSSLIEVQVSGMQRYCLRLINFIKVLLKYLSRLFQKLFKNNYFKENLSMNIYTIHGPSSLSAYIAVQECFKIVVSRLPFFSLRC